MTVAQLPRNAAVGGPRGSFEMLLECPTNGDRGGATPRKAGATPRKAGATGSFAR